MRRKKYTKEELHDPKNRARFIEQMPDSMKQEVLDQYEDMARGGLGGKTHQSIGVTIRAKHYMNKSNDWFLDVLYEYRLIVRAKI